MFVTSSIQHVGNALHGDALCVVETCRSHQ